jgi:hypothetical protein
MKFPNSEQFESHFCEICENIEKIMKNHSGIYLNEVLWCIAFSCTEDALHSDMDEQHIEKCLINGFNDALKDFKNNRS